ncbi:metal-dependent hydrolase family protein [Meiothermus hypogaeus]|uniref:Xaa-Pro dipeptidase n=2 Tax=Meiothermus hypogaeus TaxID=884155 RepID=A0A511QYS3_9DEIN|nr:amidohydrolase family protein [Meiothermus hypogaeus]RIH80320.1 Imidazolonepropionase [Meiothermus hypogaeus]GEM82541.1 Xaa-Pro dipeptidase [Meiothermus hypogaeus NBRC 106114]GIW36110.1 MAG: Xaa-Pro dipeptidase [Meiothermus sp.]
MSQTVFLVGKLLDGAGGVIEQGFLLMENNRIAALGRKADLGELPANTTVVNAPHSTLLPGLIDSHVHLAYSGAIESRAFRTEASEMSYPLLALRAAKHARETLEWGYTAVRDLNAPGGVIIDLARAIHAGYVVGPRVVACGLGLSITGGHMDKGGWGDHVSLEGMTAPCDGPDQFQRGVREQVKRGATCIKINLCGGSFRDWATPWKQEMTDAEIEAAIDETHRLEKKVAAHTSGGPSVTTAVRMGLDSVEHGRWLDQECVEAMAEKGTYYVPTLLVQENHFEHSWELQGVNEQGRRWLELGREAMWESLMLARAAGVKCSTGTDAGFMLPHGSVNAREIELFVRGGFTPLEAITAATKHGAELLDLDEVGTLEVSKIADLLLVQGDVLADVRILQKQENLRVFKDGVELVRGG